MIGGRDKDDSFYIIQICYDADTQKVSEACYQPHPPQSEFGVVCGLPQSLSEHEGYFLKTVSEIIGTCQSLGELKAKMEVFLHKISPLDETIGPDIESLTIK